MDESFTVFISLEIFVIKGWRSKEMAFIWEDV